METVKFEHKTGMEAYLWFYLHHDMRMQLDSIITFDKNLEVLVTDFGAVVAYRSDLPMDMRHMVCNSSKWCLTKDVDMLSEYDFKRLELLMMDYSWN